MAARLSYPQAGQLSARQLEVAVALAFGAAMTDVAADLGLSTSTVKVYRTAAMQKLGVRSTTQFAKALVDQGYLTAADMIEASA